MNLEQNEHNMRNHIIRIAIIGIFVLCSLLTETAPDAAAKQPTPIPTPKPQPKEWQVRGVLAAFNDELPGVQYLAVKKAVELGITDPFRDEIPEIISLLEEDKYSNTDSVAELLGRLGESIAPYIPELIQLSVDQNSSVRIQAIHALGEMRLYTKDIMPKLIELLSDEDSHVRLATTWALGCFSSADKQVHQVLLGVFSNPKEDIVVRKTAAEALDDLGSTDAPIIHTLLDAFANPQEDWRIRWAAAEALGNLDNMDAPIIHTLLDAFANPKEDETIRRAAIEALDKFDSADEQVRHFFLDVFTASKEDKSVRWATACVLSNLGYIDGQVRQILIDVFTDPKENLWGRRVTGEILANFGSADKQVRQALIDAFANPKEDSSIRWTAAEVLIGDFNSADDQVIQTLIDIISGQEKNLYVWYNSNNMQALESIIVNYMPCPSFIIPILNYSYLNNDTRNEQRFLAHFLGGGNPDAERLLTWLGKPASYPATLTSDEARETLRIFAEAWQYTQKLPETRADLAEKIMMVATQRKILWTQADLPLLQSLLADLQSANSIHADALRREIATIEGRKWGILALQILGVHLAVWLLLLLLYPFSSHIQALLWQPLFRHLFGLYFPLLLTSVPFLKRWLLRPFRQVLLADAKLEQFDAAHYFPEMEVASPGQNAMQPLFSTVPRLRGQVVIEGDSGLGKTMFARALLQRSRRAAVFLPAEKCAAGIVEAIHAKLPEVVADRKLLRKLVCGGALDLCVDGLNEVSADARATITQFVERSFEGNALLTTQPLEWQPPAMARVFVLQPLRRDRIEAYLLSRYGLFAETPDAIGQADYEAACRAYLADAFDSRQPPEMLASNQRILSNPMDAVLVTQMLARGQTPSLFRLEEQQYALMAADFARRHIGRAFPLAEFAERIYQMRLRDRAALPFEEFPDEIACMERHKMAVRRLATERTRPTSSALPAFEARRLPFELRRQIIAFFTSLPNMQHQAAQQAFINSLALDAPLKQGIKIGNASKEFFEMLVETLERYGTLEDGRDPLEAMLKIAKESVGKEGRAACDKMIEELRNIEIAPPPRQNAATPATPGEQWYFRHEKIMDYFLVQTFFGSENARPRKHFSDSRFRGVYFQLAALLPLDEARQLRETLIQYAADTKDHTVSDTFIQLLRPREILKT